MAIGKEVFPVNLEDEMRQSYLDYAMSVIVGRALPGRARRPEAGASPRAVRDARARQRVEPAVQQVGARRRRRDRQIPPARRVCRLRHARAHGAAVLAALPAGRRPGQLRFGRRRHRRRRCATPKCRMARLTQELLADIDKETVDFVPNYDEKRARAVGAADARAEPAGQRLGRHRGRHGDQHPAAQPRRSHRRVHRADRRPGARRSTT